MKTIRIGVVLLAISLLLMGIASAEEKDFADTVYQNGKVVTLDDQNTIATAIATKDGLILLVGTDQEMRSVIGPQTQVVDLKGKTLVPGFIDTHLHFMRYGLKFLQIECMDKSKEAILSEVKGQAETLPVGTWIRGNGWNQMLWDVPEFPVAQDLDQVAADYPVALIRSDNHALWVNTKALEIAGITKDTPDPEGGKILRDSAGNPTGILVDSAMNLVNSKMPSWSEADMERAYLAADRSYSKLGLTTIHDVGDNVNVPLLKKMISTNQIHTRVYEVLDPATSKIWLEEGRKPEISLYNDHLTIRAVKIKSDGALGSRGALMFEDYSDAPGVRGNQLVSEEEMVKIGQRAYDLGYQVSAHAIGDKANRNVLNAFERVLTANGADNAKIRFNLIHAQILKPEDLPRFAELKVPALLQAIHATGDMNMAEDRIGPKRILGAYAWRDLIDSGALIAGGSDSPNDYLSPIYGIHAFVTRQNHKNEPVGGWYPNQRITRMEALEAYTKNAAYISFEEDKKGTLEKGKYADFIVLSDDVLTMPAEDIWKIEILHTIIGGKEVYTK